MLEANGFPSGNMCGLFCGHLETMLHVLVVLMQDIFGCLRGLSSLWKNKKNCRFNCLVKDKLLFQEYVSGIPPLVECLILSKVINTKVIVYCVEVILRCSWNMMNDVLFFHIHNEVTFIKFIVRVYYKYKRMKHNFVILHKYISIFHLVDEPLCFNISP